MVNGEKKLQQYNKTTQSFIVLRNAKVGKGLLVSQYQNDFTTDLLLVI